ncbi:hypothetical protein CBS101457_003822 [Exobasidium rhododendri]|nr:hypothetical protein CBS101457_003822 [Exobasidium rhododendri]
MMKLSAFVTLSILFSFVSLQAQALPVGSTEVLHQGRNGEKGLSLGKHSEGSLEMKDVRTNKSPSVAKEDVEEDKDAPFARRGKSTYKGFKKHYVNGELMGLYKGDTPPEIPPALPSSGTSNAGPSRSSRRNRTTQQGARRESATTGQELAIVPYVPPNETNNNNNPHQQQAYHGQELALPNPAYPNQFNPYAVYPQQAYPAQAYPPQAYPPHAYPPQAYPPQFYPAQGHPPQYHDYHRQWY